MNTEIIDAGRDISGGYKVDVSRGTNVDRVSSEWFSRPDDERYLSLDDLFASVKGRAERSRTQTVESAAIRGEAHRDNPEKLGLVLPGADEAIAPTHWSFGQLSSLVAAPAAYLRQLPAPLAGINLQYGLTNHRAEQIKTMEVANGRTELRAVTGPDYGRIYDHELVSAVQRIAGNGMGNLLGHGVRIGKPVSVLAAGEGLETMLSLHLALPELPAVAALSANHLAALQLPADLRRLYIAVDADPAGLSAADQLAYRARQVGIDAIHLSPRLGDFNDDLRASGRDELRAHLRPQLAPEDAVAFLDHAND